MRKGKSPKSAGKPGSRNGVQGLGAAAAKAAPTTKLSSGLMDMKFMKSAGAEEQEQKEEEEQKQREHAAQWSLPNVTAKKVPQAKPLTYGELISGSTAVSGRKTFGKQPEPEESDSEEETEKKVMQLKRQAEAAQRKSKKRNTNAR